MVLYSYHQYMDQWACPIYKWVIAVTSSDSVG